MGSGDHDAGTASKLTDCEADTGCRHKAWIQPDPDTVCRKNGGGGFAECIALQATVITDHNGGLRETAGEIVCKPLGGLADRIDIHTVGAGTENTPQSARAESEITIKGIFRSGLIHRAKLS